MEKKDALRVNFAKQFVQLKQLPLSQLKEVMVAERLLDMISIC